MGGKRALGAVLAILLLLALCGGGFYFWQQNEKNKERLEKQRIAETEKAEKLEAERERELEAERIRTQKAQAAASVMLAKAEVYCETSKLDEASELLINVQRYELTPEMKSQVGELRERIERDRRRLVQQKIEEAEIAKREAERAGTRAREEQERAARERQDMLTRQKADTARLREQEKLNSGASLERELVLFINEYYRKLTSNNTSEVGSLYDDYVDFEYIKGRKASRREVVQSFSANIKRWPNRAYTPLGKTSYELINNSHTSVRLHFGYEYNYTNYSGKKAKGKAYDTVSIQKKYGRWRIVKWEQGVKRTRNDLRGL